MKKAVVAGVLLLSLGAAGPVLAKGGKTAEMKCHMTFNLKGWSVFYKTAEGYGKVTCPNGATAHVKIRVKGGGLTFGKTSIDHGKGTFSRVYSIDEIFGNYAAAEAHAGAGKATQAAVYTKGEVSLALTGKGRGIDVGIDFGRLSITRVGK